MPCNWIIIINCVAEFLIGFGVLMRALTFFVAVDLMIIDFHIVLCSFVGGPCSLGYRIGQTIALLLAVDRLLAVWKPLFYKKRQGDVSFSKTLLSPYMNKGSRPYTGNGKPPRSPIHVQ